MAGQYGKFSIRLGKTVLEMHETLRTACILLLWEEHRPMIVFLDSNVVKFWLKFVSVQVVLSQAIHIETRRIDTIVG